MGVTIHFTGKLKSPKLIPQITDEVEDICDSLGWEAQRFDDDVDIPEGIQQMVEEPTVDKGTKIPVHGLVFTPTDCESIFLTFSPTGRTMSFLNLEIIEMMGSIELMYKMFFKTQFSSPEMHIKLVNLFRYLEKKYFESLEVNDEGGYWDTNDKAVLEQRFGLVNNVMDAVTEALENADISQLDPDKGLIGQLQDIITNSLKGIGIDSEHIEIHTIDMSNEKNLVQLKIDDSKGKAFIGDYDSPLAEMTFSMAGEKMMIIDHTEVSEGLRGQGIGRKLLNVIVEKARQEKIKILPLCPYAKSVFDKDESIRDVL